MSVQIPTTGLKQCVWTLERRQTQQYSRDGSAQSIELGKPFWRVRFEYENMHDADFRALSAFIARRSNMQLDFFAYRVDRPTPLLSDESALVTGLSLSGSDISLEMNNSDGLSLGDMVAYEAEAGRYVGEVVGVSATFGNTTVVSLEPPAETPSGSPGALVVNPYGRFKLEPDSVNLSEPYDIQKRASFTARQVV